VAETIEAGGLLPASFPAYPQRRSGTCLVCGFAPTLHDDLAAALKLRPGAFIVAVNRAGTAIKADAVFSLHHGPDKLGTWAKVQHEKFGPCEVHAYGGKTDLEKRQRLYPYVEYWWPDAGGVGTSAWGARKMAGYMGFGEVILCGVLLDRAPYADGKFCRDFRNRSVLKIYRQYIRKDTAWHKGAFAMSGWPRKFLGGPAEVRAI
jgi:hypothetical protein